jgi:hypothetical protein
VGHRSSDSKHVRARALRRFTLPQICVCGAQGEITFEPRPPRAGDQDPDPAMVVAAGPFRIDLDKDLICLGCGERLGRQPD